MAAPWWVELVIASGGAGGQGTFEVVQSASRPAAAGNVLTVDGPFASRAGADAYAGIGQPSTRQLPPGATSTGQGGVGSAFSGLGGALGLPHLTAGQWRSYAWRGLKVILGLALIIMGVSRLSRLPAIVPVPV